LFSVFISAAKVHYFGVITKLFPYILPLTVFSFFTFAFLAKKVVSLQSRMASFLPYIYNKV